MGSSPPFLFQLWLTLFSWFFFFFFSFWYEAWPKTGLMIDDLINALLQGRGHGRWRSLPVRDVSDFLQQLLWRPGEICAHSFHSLLEASQVLYDRGVAGHGNGAAACLCQSFTLADIAILRLSPYRALMQARLGTISLPDRPPQPLPCLCILP